MAKHMVLITVILLVTSFNRASATDAPDPLVAAAWQCSTAALNQYALSSPDPADKIVETAFEKCSDRWREAAEAGELERDNDPEAISDAGQLRPRAASVTSR